MIPAALGRLAAGTALALGLAACGGGYTAGEKLEYAVTQFNEGVRWGRIGEVLPRVDPAAREHFQTLHAEWGGDIQIGGYEIMQTVLDEKSGIAEVTLTVSWYRQSKMEAFQTILAQRWEEFEGDWRLVAEEYRGGTPF